MIDMKAVATAGFRAGWVAACITIAEKCETHGDATLGKFFREMAKDPPPLEVGDLSTPEGQAMKREAGETLYVDRVEKEPIR